jgi:hypothetical protein
MGAFLAILLGGVGAFAGLSGAATFIPYRDADGLTFPIAATLTVISAIAAVLSILGIVSGWGLLRGQLWAPRATLGAALGCVAAVASFAAIKPPSSASPAPDGVGALGFFVVVATAYGVEVVLVLIGRRFHRSRAGPMIAGNRASYE